LTPQGRLFNQRIAQELSQKKHLVFICGHYEGEDERVREHLATDEISIGDYVLTGGELPAMVVIDAVLRLIPGVLGSKNRRWTILTPAAEYRRSPGGFPRLKVPEVFPRLY
jgi:tRNA (guanine37-N1)-methyltransferase